MFRSRVWWMVVLVLGGFLETLGWVGRTWAAINLYNLNAFMTQQVWSVGVTRDFRSLALPADLFAATA